MDAAPLPDGGSFPSDGAVANDPNDDPFAGSVAYAMRLARICGLHGVRLVDWLGRTTTPSWQATRPDDWLAMTGPGSAATLAAYWVDRLQRTIIFADMLRRRGNEFIRHEEVGGRPVLAFDYQPVLDGARLGRPVNYSLVRIEPPAGWLQRENGRPYLIIDPRAGNGSGIGGFKDESEVGCALREGHPVYFAIFARDPVPGQTLADVCAAEAEFVREVRRRHPDAPKPVIVGNCQGGWATMLLAATNPDVTGPVVVNGAPLSYWSGQIGRHPMRYAGGLAGGILPALLLSDLGGGRFDGAHLVLNFEVSNPARTWWTKYYDAWSSVDTDADEYLEFERWWSAFYSMTEAEIRWIVENLFVGNRLARGRASLDEGTHIDLRRIQSPVVVFASHGDAITPPQQALNWITDHYASVDEIRVRGQRIVYTIHDGVGHLGIFVSSEIARKEHTEIISTLKAIEALAPGLYEMVIADAVGEGLNRRYRVAFEERTIADIAALDDGQEDEASFAAVARLSELAAEAYDLTIRPLVRTFGSSPAAAAMTALHPLRLPRYAFSDRNPLLGGIEVLADWSRRHRQADGADTPFARLERAGAALVGHAWDGTSEWRAFVSEWSFYALYGSPFVRRIGEVDARRMADAPAGDLRALEHVQDALDRIDEGGFAAALVRMLILLARARGAVRRSRLERANHVLQTEPPFDTMTPKHRTRLVHRQTLIVTFAFEDAVAGLPRLLDTAAQRRRAIRLCRDISGADEESNAAVIETLARFSALLGVDSGLTAAGSVAAPTASPRRPRRSPAAATRTPPRTRGRAYRRRSCPRCR